MLWPLEAGRQVTAMVIRRIQTAGGRRDQALRRQGLSASTYSGRVAQCGASGTIARRTTGWPLSPGRATSRRERSAILSLACAGNVSNPAVWAELRAKDRVDGRGRFVMPGLADMHVHVFDSRDLVLYIGNGVPTTRNLGGYQSADSSESGRRGEG